MKDHSFEICGKLIGSGNPCFIIGEVAQAHDGSLGMAHAFIDAIANSGADAVKFQTHIAHAESTPQEPFRVLFSKQDSSRYNYWKRMEFTEEQWVGLAKHAEDRGLIFLSSPFSEEAVLMLERLNIPAWKIASGEVNNPLLKKAIFSTNKPILLSSGMSFYQELDIVVSEIKERKLPLAIFQCTSKYPSKPEEIGLNVIKEFQDRYHVPVGLSDHSGKIFTGLAAASLGANLLEVHVTFSREMFGVDVPSSLTIKELTLLVEGVRFIEQALNNPVNKDKLSEELEEMKNMFGKGLVLKKNIMAGETITIDLLSAKKPALGILAENIQYAIGKKVKRNISAGEFLKNEDLVE
jgi:N-acetylneuraminate synthase